MLKRFNNNNKDARAILCSLRRKQLTCKSYANHWRKLVSSIHNIDPNSNVQYNMNNYNKEYGIIGNRNNNLHLHNTNANRLSLVHHLVDTGTKHIERILQKSIQFDVRVNKLLVLYDKQCLLSELLALCYQNATLKIEKCNTPILMDFDQCNTEDIKSFINNELNAGDLVVLIQTGAFYLNEYRIRLELFERNLKTVEHVHLGLISFDQYQTYVDMLAFDHTAKNGGQLARQLKHLIENSKQFVVHSGTKGERATLFYETSMEPVLLNLGDYSEMRNVGGTFPVGEVFTEPKDLSAISGEVMVFGFPNIERRVEIHEIPFRLGIEKGIVTNIAPDAPESFKQVFNIIKENEEEVIVREFGIGLNEGAGKYKPLNDVTAFERQKGLHLSLGKKHTVYKKPDLKKKRTRFHIDIFLDVESIEADGHKLFHNDQFLIENSFL